MPFDQRWEEIHREVNWPRIGDADFCWFLWKYYAHTCHPPNMTFLDIGCGTGSNALMLERKGYNVVAIDGSPTAIQTLKNQGFKGIIIQDDITNLDFKPGAFDCVYDVCSLECLNYDDACTVIKNVQKWLKPDGRFFTKTATDPFDPALMRGTQVRLMSRPEMMTLFEGFCYEWYGLNEFPGGFHASHWCVNACLPDNPIQREYLLRASLETNP